MGASVRTTELGRKAITFRRMKCIITALQPEVILPFWMASFHTMDAFDFRIAEDSPTIALGFVPIDISDIGVRTKA